MQYSEFRPSEPSKRIAKELSRLIVSAGASDSEKEELLKQLPQMQHSTAERDNQRLPVQRAGNGSIGIWRKLSNNDKTYYRRDPERMFEWTKWANVHELHVNAGRRRVVLLGESVARGYLYDPYYTVAGELEAILNGVGGLENTEVIDLARISIGMDDLLEVLHSCTALEPDMVVIFAGNNWAFDMLGGLMEHDYERLFSIFKKDLYAGVKCFLDEKFSQIVSMFLKTVSESFVGKGVPVVFVIPEFNLKDWRSSHAEHVASWLPDNGMEEWLAAKREAESALQNKKADRLRACAMRMIALNSSNPLGHELLARYYIVTEQYTNARTCYEAARDTVIINGVITTPRCYKAIRDSILAIAPKLGIKVVDLPGIFNSELSGHLPGRTMFLDYCHLTVDGIKLAMRYTARLIIEMITGQQVDVEHIKASEIYPERHVQAIAHFGAAIHNAHNGQAPSIIQYHCNKAVAFSASVSQAMMKYADFGTRYTSTLLCRSFEEVVVAGDMKQYEGGFQSLAHPKGRKIMDIALVNAIANALCTLDVDLHATVDELRVNEHGVSSEGTDLLESFYRMQEYYDGNVGLEHIIFRSRAVKSIFVFIKSRNSTALEFSITYRIPGKVDNTKFIEISLNGRERCIAALPVSSNWCRHSFVVEKEWLRDGVNELAISWPYLPAQLAVEHASSLEDIYKAIHPVLGEISSFSVKTSPIT